MKGGERKMVKEGEMRCKKLENKELLNMGAEHCGNIFRVTAWRVFKENASVFWFELVCPKCGAGFDRQYDTTDGGEVYGVEDCVNRFNEIYAILPYW